MKVLRISCAPHTPSPLKGEGWGEGDALARSQGPANAPASVHAALAAFPHSVSRFPVQSAPHYNPDNPIQHQ